MFGLGIGQGQPLLSLVLQAQGTDPALNGLNAAASFLGVMLGPLLAPRAVRRLGIRNFLFVCLGLSVVGFLLLKVFDTIAAWFVLRTLNGMAGSSIFVASEAWIGLLAGDARRGRVIGIYAASLSVGFALGPLLLAVTGIAGWMPFLANAAITAIAALPLVGAGDLAQQLGREGSRSPLCMFGRAPFIFVTVAMFGLFESALMSLLPIWSVRGGMSRDLAAATLTAVYIGAIVLQPAIGWFSDRAGRLAVLRLCGAAGMMGAFAVIAMGPAVPWLFGLLFVWGGLASGLYPVALGLAGDRFRGGELVTANAAIIIAYGLGSLIGPALGGAAMDLLDPQGLPTFFAAVFAVFLVVATWA